MKLWISIVVLMFATVGHAGKAEAVTVTSYLSGSQLLELCESGSVADQSVCTGYIMGIADITVTYDNWGRMTKSFCLPDNAQTNQLKKVVIKGLNEKPENLHLTASSEVSHIFRKAFPCD